MKRQKTLRWIFILVLITIPWIYLASIWGKLPDIIPTHFGVSGAPDKFGEKKQLIYINALLTGILLVVYLLLVNIYKIDPKRYARDLQGVFIKIGMAVVIFFVGINIFILNWTLQQHAVGLNLFLVLFGILFAYMGNIMHSIKPNYFAGIRLPWTLESEANWKATHRFASKIWFAGGILIALLAIFIEPTVMLFIMIGCILLWFSFLPSIHTVILKRKNPGRHNNGKLLSGN